MSNSGDTPLADLLRAFHLLAPETDERRMQIAEALGLSWSPRWISAGSAEQQRDTVLQPLKPGGARELPVADSGSGEGGDQPAARRVLRPVSTSASGIDQVVTVAARYSGNSLEPTDVALHFRRPKHLPLLREEWFPSIVKATPSCIVQSPDLDQRAIERQITRGRPIDRVPWKRKASLRRGVVVIVDRSESMQPYWRDEEELVARLRRVLESTASGRCRGGRTSGNREQPRLS